MRGRTAALVLGWVILAGCGDDTGTPNLSPLAIAQTEDASGDAQTAQVGQELAEDLRVILTRDDEPVPDIEVQWLTTSGGRLSPGTSVTDEFGIASSSWTLGPGEGTQSASARVVTAEGSPVPFSATALAPSPPPGGELRR